MNTIGVLEDANGQPDSMLNWTFGYFNTEIDKQHDVPGPLVEVNLGDTVVIEFYNPSPEGHTIHLHGLDVDQRNDGVPSTSFFVLTGDTASYEFIATKAGTFMYHCHVTTPLHFQMGMYGALIVKNGNSTYNNYGKFNNEHLLFLSEFDRRYHAMDITGIDLRDMRLDYILVNGKTHGQIYRDSNEVLSLKPGDTCLLRVVNATYSINRLTIPNEINCKIIGSDGRKIPADIVTNTIDVYPGERYGLLLTTANVIDSAAIEICYLNMRTQKGTKTEYIPINEYAFVAPPEKKNIEDNDTVKTDITSRIGIKPLLVYPNPTMRFIIIEDFEQETKFSILDLNGKCWLKGELGKSKRLDLGALPDGIYILSTSHQNTLILKE